MNYARVYERFAQRAVAQGVSNLDTFVGTLVDLGMPLEEIESRLLDDLQNDGPLFGAFFRSLSAAGEGAVLAAEQQGATLGAVDSDAELRRLARLADADDVVAEADAETLEAIEAATEDSLILTWVATLVNTCHLCLPLHGVSMTRREWNERGLDPSSIHANEGWRSSCHCRLIPKVGQRDIPPLVRAKVPGSKRTTRALASSDIQRAERARDKAMESIEGRRLLRSLGKLDAPEAENQQ